MGKIKQGILGGFSGQVGTVVGSSWKGIAYMRGKAQHVKNPRTAGQTYHRDAIKAVTMALRPINSTLRITFAEYAKKMSAFNKAVSINYHEAIVDDNGIPKVDYSKLILSKGTLKAFRSLFIEDYSGNGNYYVSTIMDHSQLPEFDGLIFFIYDGEDGIWFSGIIKEHYDAGETLEFSGGMPLHAAKQYLGFACTYDPATGQVSNPLEYVEVNGG